MARQAGFNVSNSWQEAKAERARLQSRKEVNEVAKSGRASESSSADPIQGQANEERETSMSSDIHRRLVIMDGDGITLIAPPPHAPGCKCSGLLRYNQDCDGCLYDYYAEKIRELVSFVLTADEPKQEGRKHGRK